MPAKRGEAPTWGDVLVDARRTIEEARGIVVLTGAGISRESGISTFRDPREGLWAKYRPEELATPEAFARDPRHVWEWYDMRRRAVLACAPNPGHRAIARLLLDRSDVTLITQNVDGLHQQALEGVGESAASRRNHAELDDARARILPLHGDLMAMRCSRCAYRRADRGAVDASTADTLPRCPDCAELLRPAVVWFGEMLPSATLDAAFEAAAGAELCLVAGTSAVVHPAASIPAVTLHAGGRLIEVNPEATPLSRLARWRLPGPSGEILPELLDPGAQSGPER